MAWKSSGQGWLGQKWLLMSVLTGVLALSAGVYWHNLSLEQAIGYFRPIGRDSYWEPHRQEVKDAFVTSWDAYAKYAWRKPSCVTSSWILRLGFESCALESDVAELQTPDQERMCSIQSRSKAPK